MPIAASVSRQGGTDMKYLLELQKQALPARVTDPKQMRMLRRLSETGQLNVVFDAAGAVPEARIVELTPLGEKVLRCMRTGSLAAGSHNRFFS
jgi:DNA-binding MarR family transcriptional regulator